MPSTMSASTMKDNPYFPVMAASALVLAAVPVYYSLRSAKRKPLQRQWSFTSEGMKLGVFPPKVKAPATIINTAMYYEGEPPSVQALAEQVVTPLLEYDRFSKIPGDGGVLRDSEKAYQASDLIRTVQAKDLHETIYGMLEDPLDKGREDKPWWELVRIVNATKSVVLFRVHHCLGDGLSLVKAFENVLKTKDGTPAQENKVTKALMNRPPQMPPLQSLLQSFFQVVTLASSKFDDATAIYKKDITYSGKRSVLLFPDVPLQYIKNIKNEAPFATTINDILMCVMAQALHDYCLSQSDAVLRQKGPNLQCRALLPISLPRSQSLLQDKSTALQNAFCMVSADFHMESSHPTVVSRLQAVHDTTTKLKQSPTAAVQLWMQNNIVSKLPVNVGRQTAHDIFSRHSLVVTNVPGPEHPGWVAGKEVVGLQLFFPNVIPQVDLLTYAGTVYGNIVYDPEDWKNGEIIAGLYAKALVSLGKECGLEDRIPKSLVEAAAK